MLSQSSVCRNGLMGVMLRDEARVRVTACRLEENSQREGTAVASLAAMQTSILRMGGTACGAVRGDGLICHHRARAEVGSCHVHDCGGHGVHVDGDAQVCACMACMLMRCILSHVHGMHVDGDGHAQVAIASTAIVRNGRAAVHTTSSRASLQIDRDCSLHGNDGRLTDVGSDAWYLRFARPQPSAPPTRAEDVGPDGTGRACAEERARRLDEWPPELAAATTASAERQEALWRATTVEAPQGLVGTFEFVGPHGISDDESSNEAALHQLHL